MSGAARSRNAGLIWADLLDTASLNARPIARYVAFMFVAGVIACYGVIDDNVILIVGAMSVAPDLLPITAIGVGLVDRRPALACAGAHDPGGGARGGGRGGGALRVAQDQLDLIPSGFDLHETGVLGSLTDVNNATIVVALAAGVAGMLALETRASSAVGVAISVTTIPAVAYLAVASGLGEFAAARGALDVLGTNVAMMVVGALGTLVVQRALAARGG
jgi:uncharacterized membrane protein